MIMEKDIKVKTVRRVVKMMLTHMGTKTTTRLARWMY
jgi:hypothetical protein